MLENYDKTQVVLRTTESVFSANEGNLKETIRTALELKIVGDI